MKMAMGAVGVVFAAALTWSAVKPNPLEIERDELRRAGFPTSYEEILALEPKERN